jgi:Flp pilus assembly protein TadG
MLPMMSILLIGLLGTSALSVDLGRAFYSYRELQASTNAAALAGAEALPNSNAATQATSYSSGSGDSNAEKNMPNVTMVAGYPKLECLNALANAGMVCVAPANANAIQVQQQAVVNLIFAPIFGKKTLTLTATSTASMRGASTTPYNVAIILDATLSQNSSDDNCGATEMVCELNGVQTLLAELFPCIAQSSTCSITNGVSANSVDRVSLFTFPNVSVGTASIDSTCTTPIPSPTYQNQYSYNRTYGNYSMLPAATTPWSGVPTALPYSFPTAGASTYAPSGSTTPSYQVTPFLSDYRTGDTVTTLNTSSELVKAVGGQNGCAGMMPPNYDGNYGTYYAGVLYAAQAALTAEQTANPGSQNVIVILSDGNSTAPYSLNGITVMPGASQTSGTYPSSKQECHQAITAAQYATSKGTRVYSVAYGSETSGCQYDTNPTITPCQTMTGMASAPQYFYSDYSQSGSGSNCVSVDNPNNTSIAQIFANIGTDFTVARLIPNGTT